MAVIASDTFTRADGPLAGSVTEIGGKTWVLQGPSTGWNVVSGKVGGPTNATSMSRITVPAYTSGSELITVSCVATLAFGSTCAGVFLGAPTGFGMALLLEQGIFTGGFSIQLVNMNASGEYTGSVQWFPVGLAYNTPVSLSLTVDPTNQVATVICDGVTLFTGSRSSFIGALPWNAGMATYQNMLGKIDDFWVGTPGPPTTTGSAAVNVGSSSTVDMIGAARLVSGVSPISVNTNNTTRIFRTTITGAAPVNVGSSSVGKTTVSTGMAAVGVGSLSTSSKVYPPSGTYIHNWSPGGGLSGNFVYPLGMSVDAINIPTGVGSTGSLRWPAGPLGNSVNIPVTLDLTLVAPGTITFWRKTSSEGGYDKLRFYIDNVEKFGDSGEQAWALKTYAVSDGVHQFKWTYSKDSSSTSGQDTVWVSNLTISGVAPTPAGPAPSPISVVSSSSSNILIPGQVFGIAPVNIESSSIIMLRTIISGNAPVDVGSSSSSGVLAALSSYDGEPTDILIPISLTGILAPLYPPPVPPVDFDGLPDPTVAPIVTKSDTASGNLSPGDYRYAYAAWLHSEGQATAPSPWSEVITLTTDDTITLTYPVIPGAKGYIVYREEV